MGTTEIVDVQIPGSTAALHIAFGTAMIILAIVGLASHETMLKTREAAGWVRHTQEVLQAIGESHENYAVAESAQRGFLLSGNETFLQQRDAALGNLRASEARISLLTTDNARQQARLRRLGELTAERERLFMEATKRRAASPRGLLPTELIEAGQEVTGRFDRLVHEMQEDELRLLRMRQDDERQHQRKTVTVQAAAFALGFAVLVPAYWAVLYQSKRRVRAERRMTDLVENLPVTAWQLKTKRDSSRGFIYVGRSVERERGLAAEDVIGSTDAVLASIHEEDRPGVEAAMAEAERKLDGFDMRYRVRMPDGAVRWIHSHAALRREPDATILWSGYWVDITRQKELEFALREAKEAIESFSYSVSHDLRAPLAAIDGFSRVLAERHSAQLDGRGLHYVQRIRHNTTRMERMIDALLSLARATQGNRREQVDLSALAVELAADLREAEGARSVRFDVQGDFVAEGDPAQLRQLLANLLGNAWKFTGKHPEPLVSFGRLDGAPGTVPTFFVKDNGVGFDMAAADALFGAFQRLHDDAEFPGTGIGLATVRRIVECHGGRVWAESTPGEGATFYFTLGPVTR